MRIISDFKDYYDSASSYGIDPNLIYNRKTVEYTLPRNLTKIPKGTFSDKVMNALNVFVKFRHEYRLTKPIKYTFSVLGCCGKFYPYITKTNLEERTLFLNYNDTIEDIVKEMGTRKYFSLWVKDGIYNFFEYFNKFKDDDIFIELKSPIFHIDFSNEKLIVNPSLLNTFPEFIKIFPPFEMFNEVSQYVGNILISSESADIYLTDKQKAANHGFDKYSFRKEGKKDGK